MGLDKPVPNALQDDFQVVPNIANKCIKLFRSASMPFLYKPIEQDNVVEEIVHNSRNRRSLSLK